MRRITFFIVLIGTILLALPSCLTIEKKEYHFEFTGKEKGILTVKYVNIMSVMEDEGDVENDFKELITDYLEGAKIEREYRCSKLVSKRLYEEKGVLCGELKFEFSELTAARLYQYEDSRPLMMSLNGGSNREKYLSSNGNYGGDVMPVIFWPNDARNLELITTITKPDKTSISLLEEFKKWENSNSQ